MRRYTGFHFLHSQHRPTKIAGLAVGDKRSSASLATKPEGNQLILMYVQSLSGLEDDVRTEILPGTEIMVDTGEYHFTKSERNKIVLVPQPSNDPSDPLVGSFVFNLTKRR